VEPDPDFLAEGSPHPFYDGHVQNRWRRASGDCLCDRCGKSYYRHPFNMDFLSGIDGTPYMHQLCDGSLVKL